jgi:hypothetical protein
MLAIACILLFLISQAAGSEGLFSQNTPENIEIAREELRHAAREVVGQWDTVKKALLKVDESADHEHYQQLLLGFLNGTLNKEEYWTQCNPTHIGMHIVLCSLDIRGRGERIHLVSARDDNLVKFDLLIENDSLQKKGKNLYLRNLMPFKSLLS